MVDKRNASRITSNISIKRATFLLADWSLTHPTELHAGLPVPLECHSLRIKTVELQLSEAVADISMLQCSVLFQILFINAHFLADNASHALASSATAKPTFNMEVVVIHNGWTPKKKMNFFCHCLVCSVICTYLFVILH